jgi:porphobilinogen synthase
MTDPYDRPRRLRTTPAMRNLVRENRLHPNQFVLPAFLREGLTEPIEINGMPGVLQHSRDSLKRAASEAVAAGVSGIMLFGVPQGRDSRGSEACSLDGVLSVAVADVRAEVGDEAVVIADLCLDEFTDHGHCGVLDAKGVVDNDATLDVYRTMAGVLAEAGAHMVGTSGMMDGQVAAVREALDDRDRQDVSILAYAAKYASAFYGPFRNAVESKLTGDRRSYQQDPSNRKEALREVRLDVAEGADIVMVKPGLPYLDIIAHVASEVDVPVAAYVVSGEMAMIEYAAAAGAIDRQRSILEALTSINRAGAEVICTYWATEAARWLREGN